MRARRGRPPSSLMVFSLKAATLLNASSLIWLCRQDQRVQAEPQCVILRASERLIRAARGTSPGSDRGHDVADDRSTSALCLPITRHRLVSGGTRHHEEEEPSWRS